MAMLRSIARRVHDLIPARYQAGARDMVRRVRSPFFRGDAVYCPCCQRSFSRFLVAGSPRRPAACPRCDSRERQRLLWLYLQGETTFFTARNKVLHFAPEDCLQRTFAVLPNLDYTSGDLLSPFAQVRLDITDLQFPDETFDILLCSHVLEHVPDDAQAMRELRRVLKPDGKAIIQVPLDRARATTHEDPSIVTPEARLKAFGQSDHVRRYGLDFPARLAASGFRVTAIPYARNLDARRHGLSINEEIYVCERPDRIK